MAPSLPPLHAVRAFVSAARHLSFSRAAQELHVTHGAVSRQIRKLEDFLDLPLFERRTRQVVLTPAGQRLYAEFAPALARIGQAAAQARGAAAARTVRINVRPSFAVRWLIPRLPDFVARHPAIEPLVVTTTRAPERAQEPFDIAIRRGVRGWPADLRVMPFLEDAAVVVAAPTLLRDRPIAAAADLARHVPLFSRTRNADWDDWASHVGLPPGTLAGHRQFDHLHFVLQAAIDGLGVALSPVSLLGHDLAHGRLTSPLPALRLPLTRYYYGLAPDAGPDALQFAAWLDSALG